MFRCAQMLVAGGLVALATGPLFSQQGTQGGQQGTQGGQQGTQGGQQGTQGGQQSTQGRQQGAQGGQQGAQGGQQGAQGGQQGAQGGQKGTQGGQQGAQGGQQGAQGGQQGAQGGQQGAQGSSSYHGYSQTPWFSDPGVRKQLNLNDQQFERLNKAYGQGWQQFQSGTGNLSNLNDQQRQERMQQGFNTFHSGFMRQAEETLDPQARQRFQQLSTQYSGYDAFNNPDVQRKLNLTDEQKQKLSTAGREYYSQMQNYGSGEQASQRWSEGRRKMGESINSILNEQQRGTWREMTGDPYNFQYSGGQGSQGGQGGQGGTGGQSGTKQNRDN